MSTTTLINGTLTFSGTPVLTGIPETITLEVDASGTGAFLRFTPPNGRQRQVVSLGCPIELERFTACHRYEPFWMKPAAGTATKEIPVETQFLMVRRADHRHLLVVPLCDGSLRSSVQGAGDKVELVAETGDAQLPAGTALVGFVALVEDPYAAIPKAAEVVITRLGSGRLRRDKALPGFVDHFGWCTWDAFYQEVSQAKVREGLESFAKAGIPPRSLILDDGWQRERTMPTGERRLTGFSANDKFPGDLKPTVAMAKDEFGVETFLVWHAVVGYWGGVDGEALPAYGVTEVGRRTSQGLMKLGPWVQDTWGGLCGVVPTDRIGRFYDDYHTHLAGQGVDGVKVDNQAVLESIADGSGGRVAMTRAYRQGLESSTHRLFSDRLINCMSCATETWYQSDTSNLIRTSTDFWPKKPESHGLHLCTNAQVCVWFSEFLHADWDMFQSGHPMGAYHAAGRAVSGAPVYVSDKPGTHDAALLRKLVCADGTTLRCRDLGRPTLDCLYRDPTREQVLLKIFNRNDHGWVVGLFNCLYHAEERERTAVSGHVTAQEIPGITGQEFVLYSHHAGELARLSANGRLSLTLGELACEVVTIVPVVDGLAVVGLADKFNASGGIAALARTTLGVVATVRDGGEFLVHAAARPATVLLDGSPATIRWDAGTGALRLRVDRPGQQVEIRRA